MYSIYNERSMRQNRGAGERVLQLDTRDNVLIALTDLAAGERVRYAGRVYSLATNVPAKHKFVTANLSPGDAVYMYGVLVGRAREPVREGEWISPRNLYHDTAAYGQTPEPFSWTPPDVSAWREKTFLGYRRPDRRAGTRNYWIVLPLVFCENRNLLVLKEAFEQELGYASPRLYRQDVAEMVKHYRAGRQIANDPLPDSAARPEAARPFPNVDGVKFLLHEMGCGGTREDANALCGLLAGYICHPNVAGATVLSLGCQHAQVELLRSELARRTRDLRKPLFIFEQQRFGTESEMLREAIRQTFLGLVDANRAVRESVPLSDLVLGLKCGGSDGSPEFRPTRRWGMWPIWSLLWAAPAFWRNFRNCAAPNRI
jgi:altronate hydrolase